MLRLYPETGIPEFCRENLALEIWLAIRSYGRHAWDRTVGYEAPGSYLETYTHSYFGIGAMAQYVPASRTVLSVDALIGCILRSNIVIYLPAPYAGFSAEVRNSILNKVSVSVDYALTKRLHANRGQVHQLELWRKRNASDRNIWNWPEVEACSSIFVAAKPPFENGSSWDASVIPHISAVLPQAD